MQFVQIRIAINAATPARDIIGMDERRSHGTNVLSTPCAAAVNLLPPARTCTRLLCEFSAMRRCF
jgi:hypothetical protein